MEMSARWRLDHHGVHDVEVECSPSATVGALADALAAHVADCSGSPEAHVSSSDCVDLTIDSEGDILDPLEPAFEAVPASGSTIRLVEVDRAGGRSDTDCTAPVTISTAGSREALRYGRNSCSGGIAIHVGTDVLVSDEGTDLLYVDGALVRGSAGLRDGALIRCGEWGATVGIHGALKPPRLRDRRIGSQLHEASGPTTLLTRSRSRRHRIGIALPGFHG